MNLCLTKKVKIYQMVPYIELEICMCLYLCIYKCVYVYYLITFSYSNFSGNHFLLFFTKLLASTFIKIFICKFFSN